MSTIPDVPDLAGVPKALTQVLNDRFRRLARDAGATGPPGPPGAAGAPGTPGGTSQGYAVLSPADTVTPTLTAENQEVTLNRVLTTIGDPGAGAAGQRMLLHLVQDATGGRMIAWNAAWKGVSGYEIDGTPSTYSVFPFVYTGSVWKVTGVVLTGIPL